MELIDKESFIDRLNNAPYDDDLALESFGGYTYDTVMTILTSTEYNRTTRFSKHWDTVGNEYYSCDECNETFWNIVGMNYCPSCGRKIEQIID